MRRHLASLLPRAQGIAAPFQQPTQSAVIIASRGFADDATLKKTVLYDFHVEHGGASSLVFDINAAGDTAHTGKMVPFAGWSMPIQYSDSIMDSTKWCRTNASLFDVSHMCGLTLKGKDAISFLETLVVGDIAALDNGTGTLSVFTNEKGGIIDDTVVTKVGCVLTE